MNKFLLFSYICFTISLALIPVCTAIDISTQYGVVYYPYTVFYPRNIATPRPDYEEFSEARMISDLKSMRIARIDFVLISIDENQIFDTPAYRLFFSLAQDYNVKLCFMIEHPQTTETLQQVVEWVNQFYMQSVYFKWQGKPLLVFYECFANPDYDNSEYTVRHMIYNKQWQWFGGDIVPMLSAAGDRMTIIHPAILNVGGYPEYGWMHPRTNGDFYKEQWSQAKQLNPALILIATWNDFWEGTFITSNTLDGNLMLRITRQRG